MESRKLDETSYQIPTLEEFAGFSLHVYGKNPEALPKGWRIYEKASYNGYFACAYVQGNRIVIAHRGTDSLEDVLPDSIQIILGKLPAQFYIAKDFVEDVIEKYEKELCGENNECRPPPAIYGFQTGHSLGAILAQSCIFNRSGQNAIVIFESPGFDDLYEDFLTCYGLTDEHYRFYCKSTIARNSKIYQGPPNLINTYSKQYGDVNLILPSDKEMYQYEMPDGKLNFDMPYRIQEDFYKNFYYLVTHTMISHKMETIYQRIINNKIRYDTRDYYPDGGMQAGYIYYLNQWGYYNHADYWTGYFKKLWEKYPEFHKKYKHEENFIDDCRINLQNLRDKLKNQTFFKGNDAKSDIVSISGMFSRKNSLEENFVIIENNSNDDKFEPQKRNCRQQ